MPDTHRLKERPPKRSLTPNRSLYSSFNEAHRNIAPPTPKLPFEEGLSKNEQLTTEQVEDILNDANQSKDSRELKNEVKLEKPKHPDAEDQSSQDTKPNRPASLSTIGPQSKSKSNDAIDDLHAPVSPCESDDEHAFIDMTVSTLHESTAVDEGDSLDVACDTTADQQDAADFPDASSFYPEEGATYSPDSTDDEFSLERIKLEPTSSPVLASLPVLPPPIASTSPDSPQHMHQTHIDDVVKKQSASDYFDVTHLNGQTGTHYPIFIEHVSTSSPSIPSPQQQPRVGVKVVRAESQYDADVSDISDDHFICQEKNKDSISRLNPFHAFSAASSHGSEMNAEQQPEPELKKLFLRPHAEKEVSRALHHATGLSLPSSGIVGHTRSLQNRNLGKSPYNAHAGQEQGSFYHTPAIQPSWKVTQSGIKVPVPVPGSFTRIDEVHMEETEPYHTLDNEHTSKAPPTKAVEEQAVVDGDEDWRTVTDDHHDFPAGAVGRVMTGSSIANVSDTLLAQWPGMSRRAPSATKAWWGKDVPRSSPLAPSPMPPSPPSLPSPPPPVATRSQRQQEGWEDIELEPMPAPFSWEHFQTGEAEQVGRNEYANLPFPLVAREDAARLQAVRRASGLEDQTLSGRVLSPGARSSSQGSSYVLPRPAMRKDSARSLFPRINNPNFDCRVSIPEHQQNPFRQPENAFYSNQLPIRPQTAQSRVRSSTNTTNRNMDRIAQQAAAEAIAINQAGRPLSPHLYSDEVLVRYRAFNAVRNIGGRGTDSELGDMAATINDLPLSVMAERRQKIFFRVIMTVTLFLPFVGLAVTKCSADSILSSMTHGECSGLSFHQRQKLRFMVLAGFALWCIAIIVGLIAYGSANA